MFAMILGALFTAGRFGFAAISGVEALTDVLGKYVVKLALRSRQVDRDFGEQIVERARANAPKDTGNLINGITSRQEDDGAVIVEASAINERTGFDYARAVELGHRARRAVADGSFYDAEDDGRAFRTSTGGEVPAHPFFFPAAEEVLESRGTTLEEMTGQAADEEGLI